MRLNKISDVIFSHSDATMWNNYNFEVVLANINKNSLLKLIPNLKDCKGTIILSGLLIKDKEIIIKKCNKFDLHVIDLVDLLFLGGK